MASNDQWPPVPLPSSGKSRGKIGNKKNIKAHQQSVLDLVTEMFHSTLEPQVILSIAQNCDWELQSTIEALIALSATVEDEKNKKTKYLPAMSNPIGKTSGHTDEELLKMDEIELRQQLEGFTKYEQLKKNSTKNRMDSFRGNISKLDFTTNEIPAAEHTIPRSPWNVVSNRGRGAKGKTWPNNNLSYPSADFFMHNSNLSAEHQAASIWNQTPSQALQTPDYSCQDHPENLFNQTTPKKITNMNKPKPDSELCGLKVHYRSPGMESSSDDDDADVIIEEEINDYDIPTTIPVNVSQFLSSYIQTSPQCTQSSPKIQTTTIASPPNTPRRMVYETTLERIKLTITRGDKILVILRGLPGSGKSTLARSLITSVKGRASQHIFSTDDYFYERNRGLYKYDPMQLSDAHSWNQRRVQAVLKRGITPVIVDNTNMQAWEMRPYAAMAVEQNYIVEVLEINTPWASNFVLLEMKNIHNVPLAAIKRLAEKYERGISGQKLLEMFSLKYPLNTSKLEPDLSVKDITKNTYGTDEPPITIKNDIESSDDNLKNITSGMDDLMQYLKDLEVSDDNDNDDNNDDDGNSQQEEVISDIEESGDEQNDLETNSDDNQLLQPLGAIGSERKNSLVHSEAVSPFRELVDSGRESKENILSQCWDFTLMLNGRTLHSGHSDAPYYCQNFLIPQDKNADRMRKQDEEFGKQESRDNEASITPDISREDSSDESEVELPDINEFLENYDRIPNFDLKKSTVVITEIIENDLGAHDELAADMLQLTVSNKLQDTNDFNAEEVTKSENAIFAEVIEQLERITENEVLSLDQVDNPFADQDLTIIDPEESNQAIGLQQPPTGLGLLFTMIKTSIFGTNVEPQVINVPGEAIEQLVANKNDYDSDVLNQSIDTSHLEPCKDLFCPLDNITLQQFYNFDDAQGRQESPDLNNENLITMETDLLEAPDHIDPEKIDNINLITWKESPFPMDEISVSPLNLESECHRSVTVADASTCTSYYDFNVAYVGGISADGYRIINALNRHINDGVALVKCEKPPRKLMLDKSSMTGDVFNRDGNPDLDDEKEYGDRIPELIELFPHIPLDYLTEIYEKLCQKNFRWAVEVLLDGVPNDVSTQLPKEGIEEGDVNITSRLIEASTDELSDIAQASKTPVIPEYFDICSSTSLRYDTLQEKFEAEKEHNNLNAHELSEEKADTSDDNSSQSTSSRQQSVSREEESSPEQEETIEMDVGADFIRSLEHLFDNPDFHVPDGFRPVIQIKKSMAEELYALWIESMYQQLNARHEQLDQMIFKDAEYAKSLEREMEFEEACSVNQPDEAPNLDEIMDMELALAKSKNDTKSVIESERQEDMATRLSRKMLYDSMPGVDPHTLNEILKAHNGNFKETFETITMSTGRPITPCDASTKQKNVMDRLVAESSVNGEKKKPQPRSITPIIVVKSDKPEKSQLKEALKGIDDAKHEAQRQFSLRVESVNKATDAYRRGYPGVAAYYSQVARLHLKKFETARLEAATSLVEAQISRGDENTLDLHYLYVAEALYALDEFLEYHFGKLAKGSKRSTTVYIITGQGTRSKNKVSQLKPAVSKKLNSRNIRFTEQNPGCLKATLRKNGTD